MNFLFRIPIRYQLRLIVLITALPLVGIIISAGMEQRKESLGIAKKDTQIIADKISDAQESNPASARQLMVSLSQLPEIRRKEADKVTSLLSKIHKVNPYLTNIFVADLSGTVWATAVPTKPPFNISDRRYFKNAIATRQLSSGEYVVSRATKQPTLNLGYPIKDDHDNVIGVLAVGFPLGKYTQLLDSSNLPDKASFVLLDHNGVYLLRAIDSDKFEGKQSDPTLFKQLKEAPDETTTVGTAMSTGDERIISSRKLRLEGETSPYMYVRVGIPVDSALSKSNKHILINMMIFVLVLVLALILSNLVGERSIVARIELLKKASQSLANGERRIKIADVVKGGELGSLAESFDSMANKLVQRECDLQKSEERFRSFVENANDIVFLLSVEGIFKYVSPNLKEAFGYELDETVGKSFVPFVHPDDVDTCFAFMHSVFESGEKRNNVEYRVLHKDGTWIWYSANGSLFHEPTSNEVALLGIGRDISDRKQAETALKQRNADMEQFIYTVSHDLRSPLVTIKTFMGFLEKDTAGNDQERVVQDLQFIHNAADKMKIMLDELLELSRIDRIEAPHNKVFIKDLISDALDSLAGAINERNAEIQLIEFDMMLFGDRPRLCQIWQNLIENAIKYSKEETQPRIELGTVQQNGETVFFVKDNGIGIAPAYHAKIFGIFEKLDHKSYGAGLGLSMIQRIVEKCGGRIWVESEGTDKGSCFFFTLPHAIYKADPLASSST